MAAPQSKALVTLKEYVDARFCAIEKATAIANTSMDKRLEGMNEFREALKDQSAKLATRAELDVAQKAIEVELRGLREFRVALEAKASQQSVYIALVISIVGLAIGIVSLLR